MQSIASHHMYEGISRNSQQFSDIMEKMYSTQKIDKTFSALGKSVGDDYNVSDRALGSKSYHLQLKIKFTT